MPESRTENRDRIDVHYVANLARLQLDAAEAAQFQTQLEQIVSYFRELGELNLEGVEPMAHAAQVRNVFRTDAARPGLTMEQVQANAPAFADNLFVVPKIVE